MTFMDSIRAGVSARYLSFIIDDILTPQEYQDNYSNKSRTAKAIGLNFSYAF